jgi:hypothetical protein
VQTVPEVFLQTIALSLFEIGVQQMLLATLSILWSIFSVAIFSDDIVHTKNPSGDSSLSTSKRNSPSTITNKKFLWDLGIRNPYIYQTIHICSIIYV